MKTFYKNPVYLLLLLITLLGLFLRFYNLNHIFYYTMDEEVMNLIQRRIVLGLHYPLIGSVSPLGTYLGPYFYYIGALVLWLSRLNPLGQAYFASLLGVANILLIFYTGKELFNKKIGLLAAFFYSSSFLMIIFDRRFWQLTLGPCLSILVLLSLYKIKKGSIKFVYLLTVALILGINSDYTNLALLLFTVACWLVFKLPVRKKEILIAAIIFLLSFLPLLGFDLRHNFLNTKAFLSYFSHSQQKLNDGVNVASVVGSDNRESLGKTRTDQAIVSSLVPIYGFSRAIYTASSPNIAEQQTYCKQYIVDRNSAQGFVLPGLAALLLAAFLFIVYRRRSEKDSTGYKMVAFFYLIFQIGILGYAFLLHGDVFEHYLSTLLPYFFIILAVLTAFLWESKFKSVVYLLLGIFLVFNAKVVLTASNPYSFENKLAASRYALSVVGNQDFSLDSIGSCYKYDGYYYPFIYLGRHPVKSYQDPNYSWLYDYQVSAKHPSRVVVMVSKGRFENSSFWEAYNRYQQWVIDRKTFGGIEVLILDNSQGVFH